MVPPFLSSYELTCKRIMCLSEKELQMLVPRERGQRFKVHTRSRERDILEKVPAYHGDSMSIVSQ
jgi:hypothetical protein